MPHQMRHPTKAYILHRHAMANRFPLCCQTSRIADLKGICHWQMEDYFSNERANKFTSCMHFFYTMLRYFIPNSICCSLKNDVSGQQRFHIIKISVVSRLQKWQQRQIILRGFGCSLALDCFVNLEIWRPSQVRLDIL